MSELWLPEIDGPYPLCAPCESDHHDKHMDLHWVWRNGVDYGPMACPCLCETENFALALDQPPEDES